MPADLPCFGTGATGSRNEAQSAGLLAEGGQSRFEPAPGGLVRRQTEAQPVRIVREGAHEDCGTPEVTKQRAGLRRLRQPEQARAADDLEAGALERDIEPAR